MQNTKKKVNKIHFLWILEVAHRTEPNQIEVNQTKICIQIIDLWTLITESYVSFWDTMQSLFSYYDYAFVTAYFVSNIMKGNHNYN